LSSSPPENAAALKTRALRLLARREHSRQELAGKLAPHAESVEVLEALLEELQARRQLSDDRYAEVRTRLLARKYGAARIRHELKSKGVAQAIIEAATPRDQEIERARAVLERKYRAAAGSREERARRARFLQGRGFSADIIHRLVLREEE